MIRTVAKHLLRFVLLLAAASVIIFVLLRAVPGDPARVALGVSATEEAVAELTTRLGLDKPLPVQYADWIGGLLTGDFGISMASGKDITGTVLERAGVSLTLTLVSMAVSLAVAVPLAMRLNNMAHWIMWEFAALFENIGTVRDGISSLALPREVKDAPDARPLVRGPGAVSPR